MLMSNLETCLVLRWVCQNHSGIVVLKKLQSEAFAKSQ